MIKSTLVLLTIVLTDCALAGSVLNLDREIEQYVNQQNHVNMEGGSQFMKIDKGTYGPIEVSDGVFIGVSSIYRTGHCTMQINKSKNTAVVDIHLGLRLFAVAFGSVKLNGDDMSAVFRVNRNSFRIAYTVTKGSGEGCNVSIDSFGYEELADVETWSSLPEYDRKNLTSIFSDVVLPQINNFDRKPIQSRYSEFYCNSPEKDIFDPANVIHLL